MFVLSACQESKKESSSLAIETPNLIRGVVETINYEAGTVTVNGNTYKVSQVSYRDKTVKLDSVSKGIAVQIGLDIGVKGYFSEHLTPDDFVIIELEPTLVGIITNINYEDKTFIVNGLQLYYGSIDGNIHEGDWVIASRFIVSDHGYEVKDLKSYHSDRTGDRLSYSYDMNEYLMLARH